MTRFQKVQRYLSVIPVFSTVFIAFVTMSELKRLKAPAKLWLRFMLTFFLSGIAGYLLNSFIMTGKHMLLNLVATGCLLAISNMIMVDIQVRSAKEPPATRTNRVSINTIILVVSAIALIIGFAVMVTTMLDTSSDVADTNGIADTSLAVIDINDAAGDSEYYSCHKSYTSVTGGRTQVRGNQEKHDHDTVTFQSEKISGIMVLQVTKSPFNQATFTIDSTLERGNMEIVIVVDGVIFDTIPANKLSQITLTDVADKMIVVKIAAESAQVRICVERSFE